MDNCINYCNNTNSIQGLTRLNQDKSYINNLNTTIVKPGIYHTRNYHDCVCEAPYTKDLSLQQPVTNYRDGYGWTSNKGCNVDNDSYLRNSRNLTNLREINQLNKRPFSTVPYMGRGYGNACLESRLLPGEDTNQKKSTNSLSGVYIDRYTPQLPCIRDQIQNPQNIIPENSDPTWLRGGQPSRQIIRNKDYLNKCGIKFNGKYWAKSH